MGALGFLGIRYDKKWGGEGLYYWHETVVLEECAKINCGGISMDISVQSNMATPGINDFVSNYLKPALKGKMVAAVTGTDVAVLKTFTKKEGVYYLLNGSKSFITNGSQTDFLTLLVITSDISENGGKYHCFSLFVVPTNLPGFHVNKKLDKLGMRSSDTAELFFDNMEIPAKNLIGQEGEGFAQQIVQFQHERFSILPMAYIWARQIIGDTVKYLKKRIVFGKLLIKKQVLRHRIAKWLTDVRRDRTDE